MVDVPDLKSPNELTKIYACLIGKNLGAVVRELNISQNKLVCAMENRGYHVNQGNLSKYLSGKTAGPLGLLLELADVVQVSLDRLVTQDFDPTKEAQLIRNPDAGSAQASNVLQLPLQGDNFVTNPNAPEFRGYKQTYHVYMFSPITAERKLISGRMTLSAEGSICKAELTFDDAPTADSSTTVFTGQVVISKPMSMAYAFLSNTVTGEIHVMSFRHFVYRSHRRKQRLNSRIALLLTNGSRENNSPNSPTVFRIILSREKIHEEHLSLIASHLYLNSGDITVRAPSLAQLSMESAQYKKIADTISQYCSDTTYCWSEDMVRFFASIDLTEHEVPTFLARIRESSEKNRHNKASRKADQILRDLLLSLGYYRD